jgi:hypothetical protein
MKHFKLRNVVHLHFAIRNRSTRFGRGRLLTVTGTQMICGALLIFRDLGNAYRRDTKGASLLDARKRLNIANG